MDYIDLIRPSYWPGRSYLWIYLLLGIVIYLTYTKVSNYLEHRATYASSRVSVYNESRRAAWDRLQREIDPNTPQEDPPEAPSQDSRPRTFEEYKSEDKRKFKKIFGMDSLANRAPPSCVKGG